MQHRKRTTNDAFTRKQVSTLLNGIDNPRDSLMVKMGIFSSCRVNEIANLRLEKCDFAQGYIYCWDDKKNKWSYKLGTKGRNVRDKKLSEGRWRKIKIPNDVMNELKAWVSNPKKMKPKLEPIRRRKDSHDPEKRLIYDGDEHSDRLIQYVWPYNWLTWERVIQKWSIHLLNSKRSWHALRHTFVTLHQTAGSPIGFVKAQTGDTAATILRVYDNTPPDVIEETAEKKLF